MRLLGEDSFEQQCGVYSDLLGPVHHARGRPLQVRLVTLRTVLPRGEHLFSPATTEMRGHTLALVEDLHGRGCGPDFHAFLNQCVRHTVEVSVVQETQTHWRAILRASGTVAGSTVRAVPRSRGLLLPAG